MRIGQYVIIDEPRGFLHNSIYIGNFVHIRPGVVVGENSEIRDYVWLSENVIIGKNTNVYQFCSIGFGTIIGDNCFIGAGTITADDKNITWPKKDYNNFPDYGYDKQPPIIEDNVRVGMGSRILPGVILRGGCRIGMGAVVTKSTEPGETYIGVPARKQ